MKLKTKVLIAGTVGAVAVVGVGTVAVVKAVKRRARRVLNRKLRRHLEDIIHMRAEDFIPGGTAGKSMFILFAEKLDNKQLAALCALVQVGYFIKVSKIDPTRATIADIKQTANKYRIEERLAPSTREGMLEALNSSDIRDALIAAYSVLSKE